MRACLKERKEARKREWKRERERDIHNKDKIPKCNRICRMYTQFTIPRDYLLFFETLYNCITLWSIVTCSHTCINWFLYVVSVHISLHVFETLDTRANNTELRAEKYTRKWGKQDERRNKGSTKEGGMKEMKMRGMRMGEKKRFSSPYDQLLYKMNGP